MCFGGPSVPDPVKPVPIPTAQDPAVLAALDDDRKRRAAAGKGMGLGNGGLNSTILGGGIGAAAPTGIGIKTALGQ